MSVLLKLILLFSPTKITVNKRPPDVYSVHSDYLPRNIPIILDKSNILAY